MRILIIEDEPDMRQLLSERMQMEQFITDSCSDGLSAYEYFKMVEYDVVIMDVMLPSMDGFTLLKKIRREGITTPVLLLTAMSEPDDIVRGLDAGADDYLIKPFDFNVLLARMRALMRRSVGVHDDMYTCGDLRLYVKEQKVFRGADEIRLSGKEFQILLFMIRNQNIVLTRDQIQSNVWSTDGGRDSNVVDVYIRYLRRKIDDDYEVKLIQTIRGVGYRLLWTE
ncbi:MAG: response regulator transcription factor [Lachnospiraceae bacterium]|nr:response regulator transcription factor [Lachnospiraceae bacterium]